MISRLTIIVSIGLLGQVFASIGSCYADEVVDFDTQVMPLLTRQGCNAGACHGSASGRGGFKLSLLGSDPASDYDAIVREFEGRRVNTIHPWASLLLRKPSEQLSHEGGMRLADDTAAFALLQRWIAQGARRGSVRGLRSLTLTPADVDLTEPGRSVKVRVIAEYDDGSKTDVTQWTVLQPTDPDAVAIQGDAELTALRRGVHIVIGRYLDRVLPLRITVPMQDADDGDLTVTGRIEVRNEIDRFINQQLQQLRLPASKASDDWMFMRRVSLDLTGQLPSPTAARHFVADPDPNKRDRLIRDLLAREAFAEYWALKLANALRIDSGQLQPAGAEAWHRWLIESLRSDRPFDEMAQAMLTGSGDAFKEGPVNFLRSANSPGDLAEQTSRVFMGVRLQCANCHDHPLDHWKQDDYHGLAAIFAKLNRGRVVEETTRGEVTHPVTGEAAIPRIPGQHDLTAEQDGRVALADWLTAQQNNYFARAAVNRIWAELMGRGLVDPVDDLRATNPPSHPELLQWLADDFATSGFQIKRTIEVICQSAAYGRSSVALPANQNDEVFYSHAIVKPLEAEVVADAIANVTGIPIQVGENTTDRTVAVMDNRSESSALDVLGRCNREVGCITSDSAGSLARSLHLINGELINRRIASPQSRLRQLLAHESDDARVLDELFLATLCRPDVSQSPYWQKQLASIESASDGERQSFFEDLLWGLLTSETFVTNR